MSEVTSSEIINGRLKKILKDKDTEEFFRAEYYKMVKESLDIADIDYCATAVGILGKALENEIKEYVNNKLKSKAMFKTNSGNYAIGKIRKEFAKTSHDKRIKLLNGQEVVIEHKRYELKRSLLKKEDYNELDAIRTARNDIFHGCSQDRYEEIDAKAYSYLERGMVILAMLEKENSKET